MSIHIDMVAESKVVLEWDDEEGKARIVHNGAISCSKTGKIFTIENLPEYYVLGVDYFDNGNRTKHGSKFSWIDLGKEDIRSISLSAGGDLAIDHSLMCGKVTARVFGNGLLSFKNDNAIKCYYNQMTLEVSGTGSILTPGCRIDECFIRSSGSGTITGPIVFDKLSILMTGSGRVMVEKRKSCFLNERKSSASTGKITYRNDELS